MSINGKGYDWEDISVVLPHGLAAAISEIKYSDEAPVTERYGRGAVPRAYGRGNYKASGSFKMDREEWETLKRVLAGTDGNGKGFYDHKPFTIVVSYANSDLPTVTDILKSCRITKAGEGGGASGDDNVSAMNCEFVILDPIVWNGTPAKTSK